MVSRMEISALKTSSLWTAKKIRRQRIRGITRRRSESNAKGACRIIGGNSTSRFCTIESHGNDSKTRKLGALWNRETLKDFSFVNSWFKDNREKVFCIGLWLEMRSGYSTTTSRRKNTMLSLVNRCHRPQHQHHGFNLHDSKIMLCIWWDQKLLVYYELLKPGDSITGDRYRLQLIRLSRALREKRLEYEQRHDKVILLHDNARPHVTKVVKKNIWKRSNGMFYRTRRILRTLLLLSWLLVVPKDVARFGKSPVHFFRRNRKLTPKLDRLQRRVMFSRWEKIVGSDGQYFNWSVHSFCFEINA